MNVTRDVILDVWPLYEANEVSADTRALVDGFLAKDPEFSRLLQRADAAARRTLGVGAHGARPADPAKTMVEGVRGRLARQRRLTGAAVFASLVPFSVGNIGAGAHMVIRDFPAFWLAIPVAVGLWIWLWRTTKTGV